MAIKTTVVFLVGLASVSSTSPKHSSRRKSRGLGYVSSGDPSTESRLEAFRRGLRDLGYYIEGKNIQVEYRYVEGKPDRVPNIVNELVQLKVDVLVVVIFSSIRAAKEATKTIPIVMVTGGIQSRRD
jgi:putative tryptophan/tyrosine transport system substrate-binding protein